MSTPHDDDSLPPPSLSIDEAATPRSPTLEQLLEHASAESTMSMSGGVMIGECMDTHNPYDPGKVLVRVCSESGDITVGWLPILDGVRAQIGSKVMVIRPNNAPGPVVVGVLALGDQEGGVDANKLEDRRGPALRLERGEALTVVDADDRPLVELRATASGPRIELLNDALEVDVSGRLRVAADRIELRSRAGGTDLRSAGETVVRSQLIRLN